MILKQNQGRQVFHHLFSLAVMTEQEKPVLELNVWEPGIIDNDTLAWH